MIPVDRGRGGGGGGIGKRCGIIETACGERANAARRGNNYRVTGKQVRRLLPRACLSLNDICAARPRNSPAFPSIARLVHFRASASVERSLTSRALHRESSDPFTFVSVVSAGDPGVGGRRRAGERKGIHGGSRGFRRAHPADAEVRPQQIPELVMRLSSLQESPGRRKQSTIETLRARARAFSLFLLAPFIDSVITANTSLSSRV